LTAATKIRELGKFKWETFWWTSYCYVFSLWIREVL